MPAALEETIGISTAARLLGISEGRVRQLADSGALPATRSPHGRLFDRGDVEALAGEREQRRRERTHRRQVRKA